jgi:hypothetical protein
MATDLRSRQTRCAAALGLGASLGLMTAAVRAEVLPDSLLACRAQSDDVHRLRCYDREIDRYQGTSTTSSARIPSAATSDATPAAAPLASGPAIPAAPPAAPTRRPPPAEARLPMFKARITALNFSPSGELVVTLDNDQVWTQYVAEGKVPLAVGDRVTIRPGWLGTYLLVGPSSWLTKVHRVADAAP